MHSELFTIGGFTVHSFGVMIAIGILAAYYTCTYRAGRMNLDIQNIDTIALVILAGGILGAKVLYWMTQISQIIQNPRLLLDFTNGFVLYGGIIGGVLAGVCYSRIKQISFPIYSDLVIPSIALAQGFGRIGCFLAGCCYGQEVSGRFGVRFPEGVSAPAGVNLLPTQLISSGLDFLLFLILIIYAKRKKSDGQVTALYMTLYSGGRFVLEYFRGDLERGSIGQLSTSQFISLFIFAAGCVSFAVMQYKDNLNVKRA